MKIKVTQPTEIEVSHIEIRVPVDAEDIGEEPDFPMLIDTDDGKAFHAKIEIETGQIIGYPEDAGTRHLYAKPRDSGTYALLAPDGSEIVKRNDYVPHGVIPGEYGDYIDLEIDHRGRITNWPKRPDLAAFFEEPDRD